MPSRKNNRFIQLRYMYGVHVSYSTYYTSPLHSHLLQCLEISPLIEADSRVRYRTYRISKSQSFWAVQKVQPRNTMQVGKNIPSILVQGVPALKTLLVCIINRSCSSRALQQRQDILRHASRLSIPTQARRLRVPHSNPSTSPCSQSQSAHPM